MRDPSSLHAPLDPCVVVAHEKADEAAADLLALPEARANVCANQWIASNRGQEGALALSLAQSLAGAASKKPGYAVTYSVLLKAAPGDAKAHAALSLAVAASKSGDLSLAGGVLDLLSSMDSASVPAQLRYTAKLTKARVQAKQGQVDQAERTWRQLVDDDAGAVAPVRELVGSLGARGATAERAAFCKGLLASARGAQALACIDAAWGNLSSPEIDEYYFRAYGLASGLGPAEVLQLLSQKKTTARDEVRADITRCEANQPLVIRWDMSLRERFKHDTAGLYLRLSESAEEGSKSYCYLAQSAGSCLSGIMRMDECSEVRSIARFVQETASLQSTKSKDAKRAEAFVDVEKFISVLFSAKGNLYNRPMKSESSKRTLLHLHIALAQVFSGPVPEDPSDRLRTVKYHAERARGFWKELYPQEAFPEKLLEPSR